MKCTHCARNARGQDLLMRTAWEWIKQRETRGETRGKVGKVVGKLPEWQKKCLGDLTSRGVHGPRFRRWMASQDGSFFWFAPFLGCSAARGNGTTPSCPETSG